MNNMHKCVANVILKAGFKIHGGYVRDLIRGETPTDIDVLVPPDKITVFLERLSVDFEVRILQVNRSEEYGAHLWKCVLVKEGSEVPVDMVISGPRWNHKPDANVNKLVLTPDRNIELCSDEFGDLPDILQDICKKQFRVHYPGSTDSRRIKKLEEKGWTQVE